jgi:hypothetical protein
MGFVLAICNQSSELAQFGWFFLPGFRSFLTLGFLRLKDWKIYFNLPISKYKSFA